MRVKETIYVISLIFNVLLVYGQKPILPDFHADPSAHEWDGKYWIYPSTDEPGSTSWKQMKRWHCYSSEDLVNWSNEGEIFNLDSVAWANQSAFAPDAVKWKGKYYFIFPAEDQIGIAVSDKPNGPFTDALGKPLIPAKAVEGVRSMDPALFIDVVNGDSIPLLYFSGGHGAAMCKLKDDLLEIDGELIKIDLKHIGEGIWVHKKDSLYYFSYPKRIERDGLIKQLLVYSTAQSPYGPYTYRGVFFDNDSRNSHHSIVKFNKQWYLFYHIQGPSPYERRVCVDYLYYNEDGTIRTVEMTKEGIKSIN